MDNVDLRDGFKLGGQTVTIVTASNRKDNSIAIYKVNPQTRMLENAEARKIKHGLAVYGMCMYRSAKTGKIYYFGNSKTGDVEQWELFDNGGKVDAKKVRNFKLSSTVEGCVADDELGHFTSLKKLSVSGSSAPNQTRAINASRSLRSAMAPCSPMSKAWPSLTAKTARVI